MRVQRDHNDVYTRILEIAGRFEMPSRLSQDSAWTSLALKLEGRGKIVRFNTFWRVAASLTILTSSLFLIYKSQRVEIATQRAQQKTIYLPDSSRVKLNAESTISYNTLLWGKNRKVNFIGEGFFSVKKGNEFEILSPNGHTRILGTSFNLVARNDQYKVSCVTGKVQVAVPGRHENEVLTAGLSMKIADRRLERPQQFNAIREMSWQRGEFYFESSPLQEVLETIQRQYDVIIDTSGIDIRRIYTGDFTNKDIDETLQRVCLPLGLRYKKYAANKIKIYSELNV